MEIRLKGANGWGLWQEVENVQIRGDKFCGHQSWSYYAGWVHGVLEGAIHQLEKLPGAGLSCDALEDEIEQLGNSLRQALNKWLTKLGN